MHAVGSMLNESILRTDADWEAYARVDEEEDSSMMIIIIIAVVAILILIVAIVVIMGRDKDGEGSAKADKAARNVVAFENPMYDDPTGASAGGYDGAEAG